MYKLVLTVAALCAAMIFSSCRSGSGEITEADKLNKDETIVLVEHARHFLQREARKFKLSPREIGIIRTTSPNVRARYNGYKTGYLAVSWSIYHETEKDMGGDPFEEKTISAILEGEMMKSKDWRVSIAKREPVKLIKKNATSQPAPVSRKDFEHLLNK
jgi:hypothetical protein